MNYYRRFMGDYANHTRHLTFAEHGAYNLMLDWCYANEKPLPADVSEIYRLMCARDDAERRAIDTVLNEFFKLNRSGCYVNKRTALEIVTFREQSSTNSVNGRKGGIKRQANARKSLGENQAILEARSYKLEAISQKPETEKPTSNSLPAQSAAPRKRKSTIPEDFALTEAMEQFARSRGIVDSAEEFEAFKDYHAGKGNVFADWGRAWKTWVRNSRKFNPKSKPQEKTNAEQRSDRITAAIRAGFGAVAEGIGGPLPGNSERGGNPRLPSGAGGPDSFRVAPGVQIRHEAPQD